MSRRDLRPVGALVVRLLRGLGIATDVDRIDATRAWRDVAIAILGPDAAETTALRVDGTTLVVAVPTPAWAGEIRLREARLLERLSAASPRSGITAVRCVPAPSRRARPPSSGEGTTAP